MKKLLVTAALPYPNGRLHVGHVAGAYLPADIYVRYQRLTGREVCFVCGSDDHGVAIMLSAEKEGKTPAEVASFYNQKQSEDFKGLNINFDVYGATSNSDYHTKCSQDFFLNLYEKGFFEKQVSQQFYDEDKEMFLPDRFVSGICGYCSAQDQHGDQCENCGKVLDTETLLEPVSVITDKPATLRETVHWFLDLSRFTEEVSSWLKDATLRDHTRNFVAGLISAGLVKRSMTRDISWGVPLPIDDPDASGKVLYVWFDAPIGYISNTMQLCAERDGNPEAFVDWWKSPETDIVHFVGEDNTIFHCVIWIAILASEGSYQLPKGVIVNQFLNIQFPGEDESKISKSRGTAIWIGDYLAAGGSPDALRYYLTAIATERARSVFRPDDLVQRNNSELGNALGNFVNRIASFTHKYCGPEIPAIPEGSITEIDREFKGSFVGYHQKITEQLDGFTFKAALETAMEFARSCNKYVDDKEPWKTRKTDMDATCVTLGYSLQAIHFLAVVLAPFLPDTSDKICTMLGLDPGELSWESALKPLPAGSPLNEPEILFKKIELDDLIIG